MTEHRRIAQALQEDEAKLAAVIGSAMDAVITVDDISALLCSIRLPNECLAVTQIRHWEANLRR